MLAPFGSRRWRSTVPLRNLHRLSDLSPNPIFELRVWPQVFLARYDRKAPLDLIAPELAALNRRDGLPVDDKAFRPGRANSCSAHMAFISNDPQAPTLIEPVAGSKSCWAMTFATGPGNVTTLHFVALAGVIIVPRADHAPKQISQARFCIFPTLAWHTRKVVVAQHVCGCWSSWFVCPGEQVRIRRNFQPIIRPFSRPTR